ncbi:MAG TPA: ROK family protein [Firmicutes bacterium]|nr:ROK family protein [Bacillota bacterium]
MKNYIIGIDIGGSYIKSGIVKYDGEIVASMKIPTPLSVGVGSMENVFKTIAARLTEQAGITKENIIGVGVGSAGAVDSSLGEVCFAANLTMERFPLASVAEEALGLPVKVANDANCACLGEWKFGSGKNFSDMILVTLGTGVGGGIIVDNKLLTGNRGAGGEIGHMLLCKGGRQCSCGRKGCFEAYVSGGALVSQTIEAMQKDRKTKLWKIMDESKMITPKLIFDMSREDKLAKKIVGDYIVNLAEGLVDLGNIFRPQAIIIGGGLSAQGDYLIAPVREYVNGHLFAKDTTPQVEILQAKLGNNAGVIGAASLFVN